MPKLFKTDVASEADVRLYRTDIRSEADIVAFITTSQWEATEGPIWCYTDVRSDADRVVFFADSQWDAQITVFFTDVQSDACWQDGSKSDLL